MVEEIRVHRGLEYTPLGSTALGLIECPCTLSGILGLLRQRHRYISGVPVPYTPFTHHIGRWCNGGSAALASSGDSRNSGFREQGDTVQCTQHKI